jgi:hypothetical protein
MVVLAFFFASICSWMLYLPVQWNKFTPTSGYLARHGMPMRRHQAQGPRGGIARHTAGFTQQHDTSAAAAAKALGSPTVASPYPFSDHANAEDDAEAYRRRMMMSKHSEQHRTLIDLLRERGTIGANERVPEDDIFDDEAEAEARGVGQYGAGSGGTSAAVSRKFEDQATFATALAPGDMPVNVEPVYGARETSERVPVSNVPHIVSIEVISDEEVRTQLIFPVF